MDKYPHHILWSPTGKENFFQQNIYDLTKASKPEIKKNLYLKLTQMNMFIKSGLATRILKNFFKKKNNTDKNI